MRAAVEDRFVSAVRGIELVIVDREATVTAAHSVACQLALEGGEIFTFISAANGFCAALASGGLISRLLSGRSTHQ
jgi:hypothetical protein